MMKLLSLIIFTTMIVLNYQNCSPSHTGGVQSFSLASLYPYYEEKPSYFESVQLTEAVKTQAGPWNYQFVASVAYADDPSQAITVEIQIFDQNGAVLCPRVTATVTQVDNHILISDCESATKATTAKIELAAKLDTEATLVPLRTYTFDLSQAK